MPPLLTLLLLLAVALRAVDSAPHDALTTSPRFPRPLSRKAAAIYQSVLKAAQANERFSPVPPHLIAASASYDRDLVDYGDSQRFGDQVHTIMVQAEQEVLIASLMYVMSSNIAKSINKALTVLNDKATKQKRRIRVYIAIDSLGSTLFGGQLPPLNGLAWKRATLRPQSYGLPDTPSLDVRMKAVHRGILGSMHLKMMLVDGVQALVGSKNIDMDPGEDHTAVLEGNVVESLRADYQNMWSIDDPLPTLKASPTVKLSGAPQVPAIVAGRKFETWFYNNNQEQTPFAAAVHASMQAAERDIYYQALDIGSKPFVQEVLDAVKKGVNVTIVTSFYVSDFLLDMLPSSAGSNRNVAKHLYAELAGVPGATERLNVCWWIGKNNTATIPKPQVGDYTHVKALAIDKELVMIGSANNDPISWKSQWEDNIILDDSKVTRRILTSLANNQKSLKYCYHDDGTEWKNIQHVLN